MVNKNKISVLKKTVAIFVLLIITLLIVFFVNQYKYRNFFEFTKLNKDNINLIEISRFISIGGGEYNEIENKTHHEDIINLLSDIEIRPLLFNPYNISTSKNHAITFDLHIKDEENKHLIISVITDNYISINGKTFYIKSRDSSIIQEFNNIYESIF